MKRNRRARSRTAEIAGAAVSAPRKADARYWRSRLIQRKYADLARLAPGVEYSARIEHDGTGFFFPLGSDDEDRAAAKAEAIHVTVKKHGWHVAFQHFPREITVAIFWSLSPVTCTYTTMFTLPHGSPALAERRGTLGQPLRSVYLIEPADEVKRALMFWTNQQPGFRCVHAFGRLEDALPAIRRCPPDMLLVDRNVVDSPGGERIQTLKNLRPDLPVFSFGVYEESDWIFHSITGVGAGYFLRRRPPPEWFDPISEAARGNDFTPQKLERQVRKYFQSLFDVFRPGEDFQDAANLTQREREILVCLSKGYQDKQIADTLKISVWTVHGHVKNVFEKLGVHSRTEAVVKYLQK